MHQWMIGLSPWIIQDGNYPDFDRGQQAEFAVEFVAQDVEVIEPGPLLAELIDGDTYRIHAMVRTVHENAWTIDCGIASYDYHAPLPEIVPGRMIKARGQFGVDPFFYREELRDVPGMPPLVYPWRIDAIIREWAPLVEIRPRYWEHDRTRLTREEVARTDAWNDDNGQASYILQCTPLGPPSR